ncbi:phosphoglycerate kinase [candidate division WOR-3 bacterium JGI_Cruoil_03_44_89]|uniref:Phosphoglycerate kinase n=1 Tax=candidate division WOR-3 bacterium JGI_Cruoil_03_44_89 TaxID=1973748 RepID=A0A235BZ76_UNCW3|nr:MAG: phosphoglycerate kinase [candidate division WOR-3 bacterium JGI_Cruoil_03_44_89]
MLSLKDIDFKGKRVLLRVDFNVPLKEGEITDDTRIQASLETIKYILDRGGRLVIISHLGRPKGRKIQEMSLAPVAQRLSSLISIPVKFIPDCIGHEVENAVTSLRDGEVVLLENLRFYRGEEENDPQFARKLAGLADIYVNDAFATAHRAHASIEGVTHYIKTRAPGFLMEKEIKWLGRVCKSPSHPFLVILGGVKVSTKIGVIENLLPKCDKLLISGGMTYTFFRSLGKGIGSSMVEKDKLDVARKILDKVGNKLLLPSDSVIANRVAEDAEVRVVEEIPDGWIGVDTGPATIERYKREIGSAKTILWNGPPGVFEVDRFLNGTKQIALALKNAKDTGAVVIAGGGDTASAINKLGLKDGFTHISTGGGASLEFLAGKKLPAIAALYE